MARLPPGWAKRPEVEATFVTAIIGAASFAVAVMIARGLGPALRGQFAGMQVPVLLLAPLASLGMGQAGVFLIGSDRRHRDSYVAAMFAVASLASVACAAALAVAFAIAGSPTIAFAFAAYLPLYAVHGVLANVHRGIQDFRRWNVHRALPAVGVVVLVLGLTAFDRLGLRTVVLSYVSIQAIAMIAVLGSVAPVNPARAEPTHRRALVRFGLPSAGATSLNMLTVRADQLVLLLMVTQREVGLYAAAVTWSNMIGIPGSALGKTMAAQLAGAPPGDRGDLARKELVRNVLMVFVLTVVLLAGTLLFTTMFGEAYADATRMALVLVIATGFSTINLVLGEGALGIGAPRLPLTSESLSFLTSAVLLVPCVHAFGTIGAAYASLVAYIVGSCILAIRLWGRIQSESFAPERSRAAVPPEEDTLRSDSPQ